MDPQEIAILFGRGVANILNVEQLGAIFVGFLVQKFWWMIIAAIAYAGILTVLTYSRILAQAERLGIEPRGADEHFFWISFGSLFIACSFWLLALLMRRYSKEAE